MKADQMRPATRDRACVNRRQFVQTAVLSAAAGHMPAGQIQADQEQTKPASRPPIVDTHMHVWAVNSKRYPFRHPYIDNFDQEVHPATVEMLIDDMDAHGCTHAVLIQTIYHGWDNTYVADCAKQYPKRLKAHGLIDPTAPDVAETMEFWIKEHGLHGMRFSPIYYANGQQGGDSWLNASQTHAVWKKAEQLGAVFNFFIAPKQLPKLETMVRAHPDVPVIIDHLSQINLGADDPEPDFRLLLNMAKYPNVRVKVSELSSVSKSGQYPFADAYPHVKRVYEAFGPDRLLFGTGYPGSARAAYNRPSLDKALDLFRREMTFFSRDDCAKILGQNAINLWGFVV